ncbi:MAG TPA: MEDS domain-containing protein [Acidobacteriaceae bacterium]|nr:MEDS domain-containing protein [Acidobacteriaceae bacterium]
MASLAPIPRIDVAKKTPSAPVSQVSPVRRTIETRVAHEHAALIYDTREEKLAAVIPFLKNGLERREKCFYIADENTQEIITGALKEEGVDTDAAFASGALTILDPSESYLKNGDFDPDRMITSLRKAIEAAEAQGYMAFRIAGEATWALRPPTHLGPLIEYECRLNEFFPHHNIVAICQYNRRLFQPETLLHVIHTHPFVVHGDVICENPHYVPPEVFDPKRYDAAAEVERLLDSITENARLKHELADEAERANLLSVEAAHWRQIYEAVLANTPDLGYICDLNHRFTYANGAMLTMLGRTWDEVIGKTRLELGFDPAHAATREREIDEVIATRKSLRGELTFTRGDDRREYEYIFFPVISPTGEVEAVGCSTRDITERKKSEQALRESEQRFRTIVETTPECVKLLMADGTLLQMNPPGLEIIGAASEDQVVGQNVYDVIAPEYREEYRKFNERVCGGWKGSLQFDVVGLQGVRRHLETRAAPLKMPDGQVVHLALTRDVTERSRAENLLLEQKRLLELIATGRPLEECLTALTASVKRLWPQTSAAVLIADAAREKFERTISSELPVAMSEGIVGVPINDLAIGTCCTAIFEGRPVVCPDVEKDVRWSKSWRDLCLAHGVMAALSTPVFDSGGRAIGSFFMCFTEPHEPDEWERSLGEFGAHVAGIALERDRAIQTARESERRLEAELADMRQLQSVSLEIAHEENAEGLYKKILDAAVAIMRSDFGSIQMLYPERGAGGELLLLAHRGFNSEASKFWEWVRLGSESTCGVALRTRIRTVVADVDKCEWMAGTADLETYRATGIRAVQTTPLISRSGQLLGMISTHWSEPHEPSEREFRTLDILARQAADLLDRKMAAERQKQSEAALRKSEKFSAAGRMAATIAHEINNPLEAIVNLCYLLEREDLPPAAREMLRAMGTELDRVSHIAKQTLEFYRNGKTSGPMDIAQPINAAVTLFSRKAEAKGIDVAVEYRTSAKIFGFSGELRQVFANLIDNALEAGSTAIRIRVSPSIDPAHGNRAGVSVIIADNGLGIPAGSVSKLFQPFFTTKEEKGTGLGLWVSRGIIQKHEGWIRMRTSTGRPHRGTTFCIFLPTLREED